MYRSKELRHYQYFVKSDWAGGVYGSPSISGSRYVYVGDMSFITGGDSCSRRPGALIAGTWAVMQYMGEE